MNKLLVSLFASAFALVAIPAFADDSTMKPLSKMETQEAKAARAEAKAKWDKMTPEQQAATKKAAKAKKQADLTALESIANDNMSYDAKQGAKEAAASKAQPKPTAGERQQMGTTMDKKASSGQ
jgi:hypothetical protein